MSNNSSRRLRVLTWHVHGNYLYYLTRAHHDFYLVTKPGHPPGYAGTVGVLPWGNNVHEVPADRVASREFDVILFQHKTQWDDDRINLLSEAQRRLPRIYIEHDPPQENAFEQRHWVDDANTLLVHVTHFNQLMWDCGITATRVIEHGVIVPDGVRYTGEKARGIVVINHLRQRGRRLGVPCRRRSSQRCGRDKDRGRDGRAFERSQHDFPHSMPDMDAPAPSRR